MNSLTILDNLIVPPQSALSVPQGTFSAPELPIANIREYLSNRSPVPHWEMETRLFCRLPFDERSRVKRLQAAIQYVRNLIGQKTAIKVQPACEMALAVYTEFRPLKTFRAKHDTWQARQDWLVLANRAVAGKEWQAGERGLPEAFLDYVAARMGEFRRGDAGEQAIRSIQFQWQNGRTHRDIPEVIPGYEANWEQRSRNILPMGWTRSNIRRQLDKRSKFSRSVKALLHEGIAAARSFVPHVHGTRADLRFMEQVQFDDVRCDFRVLDTDSGQVNDLWLLVARDVATTMLLGFGMRPARAREDGTQEHLKLQDMKQLAGWLLETYGLPPYQMTWTIENGTATLTTAVKAGLEEMIGADRINIAYAQMVGGKSPLGYGERAVGNSKAKAMLESLNRLQHVMTSHFPGQIGMVYSLRPAEIAQREKEATEIWTSHRPEDRAQLRYPFYTIPQARAGLFEVFGQQNRRTDHACEDFAEVAEWFDGNSWQPAATAPADMLNVRTRTRMESPIERAARLLQGCAPFTRVSPEILTAFYQHTQRHCVVKDSGEIQFSIEGKILRFTPPTADFGLAPGTECLGYCNPDEPRYLTLTDGRGSILGTWMRRGLVKHGDREALAEAIRYSAGALKADKARAVDLAAGDRQQLEDMREHNNGFVTVVEPRNQVQAKTSPIAQRVTSLPAAVAEQKQSAEDRRREVRRAFLNIK